MPFLPLRSNGNGRTQKIVMVVGRLSGSKFYRTVIIVFSENLRFRGVGVEMKCICERRYGLVKRILVTNFLLNRFLVFFVVEGGGVATVEPSLEEKPFGKGKGI